MSVSACVCVYGRCGLTCIHVHMETLRPININRARQLTQTTLFSPKRKKLLGWD